MNKLTTLTLLILVSLLLPGGAVAQSANKRTAGTNHNWPRTFGGQPDFEFDKQEVLKDRTLEATRQGLTAPVVPSITKLLDDERINLVPVVPISATTVASTSDSSETMPTDIPEAFTKLQGFDLPMSQLPSLTTADSVDLTEFKAALTRRSEQLVADYNPEVGRYGLDYLLRGLILQAIVTSPEIYAVINGVQYRQGERFRIPVNLGPTDADFIQALQQLLPAEGSVSEAQAGHYQAAFEAEIQRLSDLRNTNPTALTRTYHLPATILSIDKRTVVLDFNGQRHELSIRFAY